MAGEVPDQHLDVEKANPAIPVTAKESLLSGGKPPIWLKALRDCLQRQAQADRGVDQEHKIHLKKVTVKAPGACSERREKV